jgi:hypothetical protein
MLSRNQRCLELNAQVGAHRVTQVASEGLVQAIDGLHMLLPDLTCQAAVPQGNRGGLDNRRRDLGRVAGTANHLVDFLLA